MKPSGLGLSFVSDTVLGTDYSNLNPCPSKMYDLKVNHVQCYQEIKRGKDRDNIHWFWQWGTVATEQEKPQFGGS